MTKDYLIFEALQFCGNLYVSPTLFRLPKWSPRSAYDDPKHSEMDNLTNPLSHDRQQGDERTIWHVFEWRGAPTVGVGAWCWSSSCYLTLV